MAGVIVAITASGRAISRIGRYKIYPVVGTALAAVGLGLLSRVSPGTPPPILIAVLLLVGCGVGLTMQVLMLVAQNAAPHADLGAATSAVTFLRQIGASVGVAAIGAVITSRFAARLPAEVAERPPGGGAATSAADLAALPPGVRADVAAAFGAAVPPVFGFVAPLLAVAFLLALALPARPLRDTAHVDHVSEARP
jgi:MFS family permease